MSNDNAGRTSRSTSGSGPMGSTVAIVITAVALVLGFLILQKVNDEGSKGSSGGGTSTTSSVASSTSAESTTTSSSLVLTGTKVQVANCSGLAGMAGQMTTALQGAGFDTATATNCSAGTQITASKVVFDPNNAAAKPVADSVAAVLGGIAVEPASGAPAVEKGAFADGSGVIVMLAKDLAGKTLAQINQQPTTGTTLPPVETAVATATT